MTGKDRPMASLHREGDNWVVAFERRLDHPRDRVWQAITESAQLEHWMPCDIVGDRRAGAPITLRFWPPHVAKYGIDTPELPGEIRVWDPPTVFEWTWSTDLLQWELYETPAGTVLGFTTHLGPDDDGAANTAAGYHACLDNLVDLLDTGTAEPLVDADVEPLERHYRQLVHDAD